MQLNSPPVSTTKKKRSLSTGTPASSSRKASKKRVSSSPTSAGGDAELGSDSETIAPPRRQSLMRKARMQTLSFMEEASESEDNPDDLLPRTSVAARLSKRLSSESGLLARSEDDSTVACGDTSGEKKASPHEGDEDEEMVRCCSLLYSSQSLTLISLSSLLGVWQTSFRSTRRRVQSSE